VGIVLTDGEPNEPDKGGMIGKFLSCEEIPVIS